MVISKEDATIPIICSFYKKKYIKIVTCADDAAISTIKMSILHLKIKEV
jgi:hypothetical protein